MMIYKEINLLTRFYLVTLCRFYFVYNYNIISEGT